MSAWAELVNSDGSDEHLELCERALKEVRAEVLKGLLRNLTEVRGQRGAERISLPEGRDRQLKRMGEIDGLNIAIAAVKRRMR